GRARFRGSGPLPGRGGRDLPPRGTTRGREAPVQGGPSAEARPSRGAPPPRGYLLRDESAGAGHGALEGTRGGASRPIASGAGTPRGLVLRTRALQRDGPPVRGTPAPKSQGHADPPVAGPNARQAGRLLGSAAGGERGARDRSGVAAGASHGRRNPSPPRGLRSRAERGGGSPSRSRLGGDEFVRQVWRASP